MDDKRFEAVAKTLTNPVPRRRVAVGLGGGLLAALTGLLGRGEASASGCYHPCYYSKGCCVCPKPHKGKGNNGFGNGGDDGSPNGKQDDTR